MAFGCAQKTAASLRVASTGRGAQAKGEQPAAQYKLSAVKKGLGGKVYKVATRLAPLDAVLSVTGARD